MGRKAAKAGAAASAGSTPAPPAAADEPAEATPTAASVEPVVIDKWDIVAVKNNLDDAFSAATMALLPGFEQRHTNTDVKLAMSTLACLFAGAGCLYGFLVPHPESATVVGACVCLYFVCVTLLNIRAMFFERNTLLEAAPTAGVTTPKCARVEMTTSMQRFSDQFEVFLALVAQDGATIQEASQTWSVADFVYEDGVVATDRIDGAMKGLFGEATSKSS